MAKEEGKIRKKLKKKVNLKPIVNIFKKLENKKGDYILCFILSLIVIASIFIIKEVTPFGINTLLDSDFFYQYDVMLAEIRDRVVSHSDLVYSFRSGLGLPLYRNFFNYLASPVNIIALFVKRDYFMLSFSFIIGTKAIISACAMYYFLKKRFYDNGADNDSRINKFIYISLAILYAFSGYFSSYYINLMWLDGMMLLPILAISIDELIIEHKWKKYCISLVLVIVTNYYIGYMLCIFSCLYFLYSFFINTKFSKENIKKNFVEFIKQGFIFALASILAASMCMVLIFLMKNTMSSLDATKTNDSIPTEFGYEMIVKDVLLANFNGACANLYYSNDIHVPHISVGVFSIILFGMFLLNRKISFKEKFFSILLLGGFFAAFFVPQIDFVIHAFHEPNDYPFRYAFIYSFIFIMIAGRELKDIKKSGYLSLLIMFGAIIAFLLVFGREEETYAVLNQEVLIMNIVFLSIYVIILLFGKFFNYNRMIVFLMLIVVPVEIVLMYRNKWDICQDINSFADEYNSYKPVIEQIKDTDEEKFYRMDKIDYLSLNDGCWNEYNGVTIFSSMAYDSLSKLVCALGIPGNKSYSYIYNDTSPLFNLLFDVKYVLDSFELENTKYYDKIDAGDKAMYKFKYTNGIGFGVNDALLDLTCDDNNPFELQNNIVKYSTGTDKDIFSKIKFNINKVESDENRIICEYIFENPNEDIYFYPSEYDIDFIKIGNDLYSEDLDNSKYADYEYLYPQINDCNQVGYDDGGIIKIQTKKKEVKIVIAYTTPEYLENTLLYTFNDDVFTEFYNTVKQEKLEVTRFDDSVIEANIELKDDKLVYTSIPYDKDWNVYVDGQKVETLALNNSLLCFYAGKGKHDIRFEYKISKLGLAICGNLLAIVLFILLCIDGKQNNNKNKRFNVNYWGDNS